MLASQKPLRASPQGQHDENANGDVIGNEHGIPTAQIAPNHARCLLWAGDYSEFCIELLTLNRRWINWDNSPNGQTVRARRIAANIAKLPELLRKP